jgi:dihydrofolate reductase
MTPESPRGARRPLVSLVVAAAANGVIGRDNALPWHLPADLKHFKATTMGRPIVMGRRTFEAIGRALPGRLNIVVTRQPAYAAPGCAVVGSLDAACTAAGDVEEICIIGGGELYRESLPHAGRLHLTEIHAEFEGDAHFPPVDRTQWREVWREVHEGEAPFRFDFVRYDRVG